VKDEPLRLLLVEDSDDDALLVLRELTRSGFAVTHKRVQTLVELDAALAERWDIVLSDYTMPQLEAPAALAEVRRLQPDTPFVVVSGTIGEETAVEVMRAGANDYLLKQNLRRLGPAVSREIRDGRARADRRRLEEAQKQAEASFRLIVESTPDLVLVHRNGKIVYVNPTTVERLGYAAEVIIGQPIEPLVSARRAVRLPPSEGSERPSTVEQLWRRADGRRIAVEVVSGEVLFEGEPATLLMGRDLTERDRIAAAMIEMDRMAAIGILAAGVGHEINNPLAYVLANLEFVTGELDELLAELPPASQSRLDSRIVDLRQALADTNHGAQRVRDIVGDLRTFSRGEDEKLSPVDVRQVLDSSLRMAAVQIRQRATVIKHYADVPPILANESRLGQVFLNLVVNAAQALPEGRPQENRIQLDAYERDGRVVVEIADSGSGIPSDVLPRIFDPFFTTKPAGQGTGLGLSICKRIVNALGGDISVSSTAGETRFTVQLPRASAASERPRTLAPPREARSRRARLLCVDDEEALGVAMRRVLGDEFEVFVTTSAAAARDRVASGERFDLVLCDLMMPGMSGMDLHHEIERLAPELAPRIIFLTGGAFTGRAREFLDAVPNPRLEKPVGVDELRAAIGQMLEQPEPARPVL